MSALTDLSPLLYVVGVMSELSSTGRLLGALCGGALAAIAWRPREVLRLLACGLAHALYRLDRRALDPVPGDGAALLVANHVSFVDALLIAGLSPRT